MVVFTGVSGSGKSSLAKDIIYAEGQRCFLDCLSPYARQFIRELKQPDIDTLTGVPPTICVYQHTFQPGSRSTVGTLSEIYNYLRLLFAKIGIQHCPDHPEEIISPLSPTQITEDLCELNASNIKILSPVIKAKKGSHKNIIARAQELELTHIRVDGRIAAPSIWAEGLERNNAHTIEYIIASFNPKHADKEIVAEVVGQALSLGSGNLIVLSDGDEKIFSTLRNCPICRRGFLKPDPADLSFSSRRGRCVKCDGLGQINGKKCSSCHGARITEVGRNLRIRKLTIHEMSLLPLQKLYQELKQQDLTNRERIISESLLSERR